MQTAMRGVVLKPVVLQEDAAAKGPKKGALQPAAYLNTVADMVHFQHTLGTELCPHASLSRATAHPPY